MLRQVYVHKIFYSPWPEEINRQLNGPHCHTALSADCGRSRKPLKKKGVSPSKMLITGNTVIDALLADGSPHKSEPGRRAEPRTAISLYKSG